MIQKGVGKCFFTQDIYIFKQKKVQIVLIKDKIRIAIHLSWHMLVLSV